MMRRWLLSLIAALACYLAGAFGGGARLLALSTNTHDRGLEAAMTGALVFGPAAAVIGFLVALPCAGRRGPGRRGQRTSARPPTDCSGAGSAPLRTHAA